ncbi:hypothetical protein TEQG_03080 [Trichophyton equinum CBS 127.97]|uniref:Uncharacterized protein n=1 Tax=Trichophyton equinum (strain ATCC MYA-4606 / CBS 127.97) TaxID=559882 RepID=F2PQ78_TRIEC|nr:hypothetical protein TEQG_03080 [Trichophyton equinum CBS 127.97]
MRPLADKRCTQFNLVPLQTDNSISGPTDSKSSQYQLKDAKVKLVSPLKKPAKVIGDGTRDLLLKKIVDSGESTAKALNIRNKSPWSYHFEQSRYLYEMAEPDPARVYCWIGGVEHCYLRNSSSYQREMNALAVIMMELMEKDTKESGLVGVNDLERWPSDSEAVEFLSATTSSDSINQLKKHSFISKRWGKGYLIGLVSFALISTRTFYSY